MGKASLKDALKNRVLVLDGAMGTQLIARGVRAGECNELMNVERADIVLRVHKAYMQAGSDAILTNTFGANRYALGRHGLAEQVRGLNIAGVRMAREAAERTRYVFGDIGPSGDFLEPVGSLKADELKAAFSEQARALAEGGVDAYIIETFAAMDEVKIAIEAAKSAAGGAPVLASMSFDKKGEEFRTMMGVDVATAVGGMISAGADIVGFNCGTLMLAEYVELAGVFVAAVKAVGKGIGVLAEPNAGKPELVEGKTVYKVTPEEFAAAGAKIRDAGVVVIGGCCGTGPEHIKALARKLKV